MPIQIKLQRSRVFGFFILFIHIGALVLTALMMLPVWLFVLMAALILFSLYRIFDEHVLLKNKQAITELNWDRADVWALTTRSGEKLSPQLLPTSFVNPALVVLNFKLPEKKRSVVLFPD